MNYAIVRIGGKQYKVFPKDIIIVDKAGGGKGEKIKIEDVLLFVKDDKTLVGRPKVDGVSFQATILEQLKGKKQRVVKFKPKSRYKRVLGARRFLTKLEIGPFGEKKAKTPLDSRKVKEEK